jgi:hypothetical protein
MCRNKIKRNHVYDFSSFYSDSDSSNSDGSIPILSVMLATDSIDPSVKYFLFFSYSIDHWSPKKIFSDQIEPWA